VDRKNLVEEIATPAKLLPVCESAFKSGQAAFNKLDLCQAPGARANQNGPRKKSHRRSTRKTTQRRKIIWMGVMLGFALRERG